ncbi:hypothetical protein CMQ_3971 [Grosmannia clavigera kw1407]|uniref:Uncharacterized protein n=1 Tax=Grosmannia clavigera (strain kw1407 / UAMH 11150) TaxID=655863 RepID=F0X8K9_GROCL|nr:uncharacterized protein CMQ_3971 [Grosmannia clavigera kw1407]EFX05902.1 hypothetical protein CMQ_3971 [Grosmannia clavigera kw1407]
MSWKLIEPVSGQVWHAIVPQRSPAYEYEPITPQDVQDVVAVLYGRTELCFSWPILLLLQPRASRRRLLWSRQGRS